MKVNGQENWCNHLKINQKETVNYLFDAIDSVELTKSTFSIRFYNKPYDSFNDFYHATKICIQENIADTSDFKVGQPISEITCFKNSSAHPINHHSSYPAMILSPSGHHLLYYESKKHKRAHLIVKHDDYYELEWEINFFNVNGMDLPLEELPFKQLFMLVLNDSNLNEIIDAGEMKMILLKFS